MHCVDSFAGSLILLVIIFVLINTCKGSLMTVHVCIGRDWKECCFIYGSIMKLLQKCTFYSNCLISQYVKD